MNRSDFWRETKVAKHRDQTHCCAYAKATHSNLTTQHYFKLMTNNLKKSNYLEFISKAERNAVVDVDQIEKVQFQILKKLKILYSHE